MKRIEKKNLRIIAVTSMTLFSLLAATTGVFAWFVSKLNESSDSSLFEVDPVQTSIREISIHSFYGTSTGSNKAFGFNPIPTGFVDYSNPKNPQTTGSLAIELEKYSLDDPHHPILILFKVEGVNQSIVGETSYPFLSQQKPGAQTLDVNHTVATYADLAAKASSASDGEMFEVTNDEHQNGEYTQNGSRKKITTRYQYVESTSSFELIWVDLAMYQNPLSSIMEAHSFLFSFECPYVASGNSFVINPECDDLESRTYTHTVNDVTQTDTNTGIWIPTADFKDLNDTDTNASSFVNIGDNGVSYSNKATMFDGSVSGYTYLGIVIDYYPDALVYLSSEFLGHNYLNNNITFKCDWVTKV